MYLRRFKASPNACPIKQEEHRRRARARKLVTKPTSSTAGDSDSSGDRTPLAKLKQRLPLRPHAVASVKHNTELNGSIGADHDDPTRMRQHFGHDREHQELCHDHRASSHKASNNSQEQNQSQEHQEQAEQDEEEESYHRAGLQKPRKLGEGTNCLELYE